MRFLVSLSFVFMATLALSVGSAYSVQTFRDNKEADGDGWGAQEGENGCVCSQVYEPVCTADGRVFSNACKALCAGRLQSELEACPDHD